jgi:hypothetical protein
MPSQRRQLNRFVTGNETVWENVPIFGAPTARPFGSAQALLLPFPAQIRTRSPDSTGINSGKWIRANKTSTLHLHHTPIQFSFGRPTIYFPRLQVLLSLQSLLIRLSATACQ